MASMHICLHTSLHGYFFIKLQLHFHTIMNQYVNKSIRQRIIEASKKRPFSTKGISPSIEGIKKHFLLANEAKSADTVLFLKNLLFRYVPIHL